MVNLALNQFASPVVWLLTVNKLLEIPRWSGGDRQQPVGETVVSELLRCI